MKQIDLKFLLKKIMRWLLRGNDRGLSPIGLLVSKSLNFLRFSVAEARLEWANSLPTTPKPRWRAPNGETIFYDLGANEGQNISYYLSMGFRVVAVEASSNLCELIRGQFAPEIASGKLMVLQMAITEEECDFVEFSLNLENPKMSGINPPYRSENNIRVSVPAITLERLTKQYGTPFGVKIDIEGLDAAIVNCIRSLPKAPAYVSAEIHDIGVLSALVKSGYDRFKVVEGSLVGSGILENVGSPNDLYKFPRDSAGPFCEDVPGPWYSADAIFEYLWTNGLGWKDVHAKHSSVVD